MFLTLTHKMQNKLQLKWLYIVDMDLKKKVKHSQQSCMENKEPYNNPLHWNVKLLEQSHTGEIKILNMFVH